MNAFHLADRLQAAVSVGLVGAGQAHRVALAAELNHTLPAADGRPIAGAISGEALARGLGLSRAAVHKHVAHLRSLGFAINSLAGSGYRLDKPYDDLLAAEAVVPRLLELVHPDMPAAWVAGLPYHYRTDCVSTNAELRALAATAPAGTMMVTDHQTGGRGRLGRTWISRPGEDLTFSVLLRPTLGPAQAHLLSLAAALAVAEVLDVVVGTGARAAGIKWPNDVLLGGEKVCGILLEGSMDADRLLWVVAGVGLNVNSDPGDLLAGFPPGRHQEWLGKPRPTSLRAQTGRHVPRGSLLVLILAALMRRWEQAASGDLLDELRRRDVLAGRRVEVFSGLPADEAAVSRRASLTGEALGIGPEGQLLVRADSGAVIPVFAGDVTVRSADGKPSWG